MPFVEPMFIWISFRDATASFIPKRWHGAGIVDAAHIGPCAAGENDDIQKGLALCKNAQWMFDEGLRSVQADSLVRLMKLNEAMRDPKTVNKIRQVLMLHEFTKVDGVFAQGVI